MSSTATRQAPAASPTVEWRQAETVAERWPMLVERREASWARDSGKWDQVRYAAIDFLLLCLGNLAAYSLRLLFANPVHGGSRGLGSGLPQFEGLLLLHAALGVMACIAFDVYHPERHASAGQKLSAIAKSVASATALLAGFAFLAAQTNVSFAILAAALPLDIGLLAAWRLAARSRVRHRVRRGDGLSRVLIVGAGRTGKALASCLQANPQLGYTVCGFLDNHANGDARLLGPVQDFRRIALAQFADQVFVTASGERELVKSIFVEARRLRMNLSVVPELYDGLGWSAPLESIGGFPVMRLHAQPIPAFGLAIKRAMDLAGASCGLLVTAPLLLLAAVWIRMDSTGPVFYTAARVGRKGRKFHCYKLRTMTAEADGKKQELRSQNERHGPFFKMENDPRLTRSGKWLRRLSIDELPQLLNVLLGDMSLVGPRPHPVDDFELYSVEHLRRLDVKPGVTGLWQVSARTDPSFETSMALDLEYIETWSLRADLRILLKTIPVVFRAEGS